MVQLMNQPRPRWPVAAMGRSVSPDGQGVLVVAWTVEGGVAPEKHAQPAYIQPSAPLLSQQTPSWLFDAGDGAVHAIPLTLKFNRNPDLELGSANHEP